MKLMTLNTQSLMAAEYEEKLRQFVAGVLAEMPDVIALQEVNQSIGAAVAAPELLVGYVPAQTAIPVRADNHAAHVARLLREAGVQCSWTYLPVKVGYSRFDEGLAMLALNREICHVERFLISRAEDYTNWKTRRVLGIQVAGMVDWFYTVHMGWWTDEQEPFLAQWKVLNAFLTTKPRNAPVWLMGDFNSPAEVRGEGYDKIAGTGWYDTFQTAEQRDSGITVPGVIDGWENKLTDTAITGMRIDHIWCSLPERITSSTVVFNGVRHPVVSDHFGVMIEVLPQKTAAVEVRRLWDDEETDEDSVSDDI